MTLTTRLATSVFIALASLSCEAASQKLAQGHVQEVSVHGASLEGNALGVSADRTVAVYLPPSYQKSKRKYPVVYVLHGILDSHRTWTVAWGAPHPPNPGYATIQDLMDRGIANGAMQEMIVVIPDADKSCHYTDSPVKGGWSSFIASDLVQYVDRTYRTVASPDARGILGHSMGGHGALKLAMTRPGVFGAVYAMNPSLLGFGGDVSVDNARLAELATLARPDEVARAGPYAQVVIGVAQCFSPDVSAPLMMRAPFVVGAGGRLVPGPAYAEWMAQMPVYMAPKYVPALRALRGLRFDSAFEDEFSHIPVTARAMSAVLDSLGVDHTFEMYNGDHRNRLWGMNGRLYNDALPFLSRMLTTTPAVVSAKTTTASPAAIQEQLWDAARKGDIKRAEQALTAGADLHMLDTLSSEAGLSGRRALNFAALHNQAKMVRWLVERGADLNRPNRTGFTPLHHAAESGAVNAVEELLKLGADPNATLPSGSTPLRVAQQRRHATVVQILTKVTRVPRW